ncbi:urokinase plasminogen activator surface receptor-like [Scleropages formosus]|uniref:Urokinase plasminogen activator surface receptor-like n=1 Tax=Scleropages formosus TaxID=113540 RepID=A0A8C9T999_SCLFO|nr:urokinase plasminogen activator surface receptor-like [Scleropages formosus]
MKLLLQVILTCAAFSKGYPLNCYECIPGSNGKCTETTKTCPSDQTKCGSMTTTVYIGNSVLTEASAKSCAKPQECTSGSINFGVTRTAVNTECCNTGLCNSQNIPAWSKNAPNGKRCFTCNGNDCTSILNCVGDENSCLKTTVSAQGGVVTMKGCVSSNICAAAGDLSAQLGLGVGVSMNCCEGNLCNDARRTMQSILLLLVPLVSTVLIQ